MLWEAFMTLLDWVKTLFFVCIMAAISPTVIRIVQQQYHYYTESHTAVACITISGFIDQSASYVQQLHSFFEDPEVKAILLKIDCHGATMGASDSLFREINVLKNECRKPIIGLIENVCTGGGYHIACATDSLIAPSIALIGSIGVAFPHLFQCEAFMKQHNLDYAHLKAGAYTSVFDPFVTLGDAEKIELQKVLDDTYSQLIHHVATSRRLSLEESAHWAEGKLFTGQQAFALGLIDEVGSWSNAIKTIKDKALIEGKIDWIYPPQPCTMWTLLSGHKDSNHTGDWCSALLSTCIRHLRQIPLFLHAAS